MTKQGATLFCGDSETTDMHAPLPDADFRALGGTEGRFFMAPAGLPGVRQGAKLYSLCQFTTSANCPLGAGLSGYHLQQNVTVVNVPGQGFAWVKRSDAERKKKCI